MRSTNLNMQCRKREATRRHGIQAIDKALSISGTLPKYMADGDLSRVFASIMHTPHAFRAKRLETC